MKGGGPMHVDPVELILNIRKTPDDYIVVDCNRTLIFNDCMDSFMNWRVRRRHKGAEAELFHYRQLVTDRTPGGIMEACRFAAGTLAGLNVRQVENMVFAMLRNDGTDIYYDTLRGRIVQRGVALRMTVANPIMRLKTCGVGTWVMSSSPQCLVEAVMKYFHMDEYIRGVIGLRNKVNNAGILSADFEAPTPMFMGKVRCIRRYISATRHPLAGFGNSRGDLPMLEFCPLRFIVDQDNVLGRIAKEQGWHLLPVE